MKKFRFLALISSFQLFGLYRTGAWRNGLTSSTGLKIANAFVSFVIYIEKMFWPTHLIPFYVYPRIPWPLWQTAGAAIILAVVTATVVLAAKRFPYLAFGWLWFMGTLMPVIGIVQIADVGRADRFTYVPLIGLFIMVAWGAAEILKGLHRRRTEVLVALSALALSSLSIVTWRQVGYWRNSLTLYDYALEIIVINLLHIIVSVLLMRLLATKSVQFRISTGL